MDGCPGIFEIMLRTIELRSRIGAGFVNCRGDIVERNASLACHISQTYTSFLDHIRPDLPDSFTGIVDDFRYRLRYIGHDRRRDN